MKSNSNLKRQFTTVTSFSKLVALILFIALPIAAFYFGTWYQAKYDAKVVDGMVVPSSVKTYKDERISFQYPDDWTVWKTKNIIYVVKPAYFASMDPAKPDEIQPKVEKIEIIKKNNPGNSLDDFLSIQYNDSTMGPGMQKEIQESEKPIMLGSEKAIRVSLPGYADGGRAVLSIHDNTGFDVRKQDLEVSGSGYTDAYNMIIKTFQFSK